jgi:FMN phosphatase YigB (HAD superfamily)
MATLAEASLTAEDRPLIDESARAAGMNAAAFVPHTWSRAWLNNRREIGAFLIQEVDRDKIVLYGKP